MLSRVIAVIIIGFWLVMTGLLVRFQVTPERSELLNVPISHVLRLLFQHAQRSDLRILNQGTEVGQVSLRPKVQDGVHSLSVTGNVAFRVLGGERQQLAWGSYTEFDDLLALRSVKFHYSLRDPSRGGWMSFVSGQKQLEYELWEEENVVERSSISLNDPNTILRRFGIDPNVANRLREQAAPPTFTARRTRLKVREDEIDLYALTLRQGELTVADIYISQLGNVLLVRTPFGYHLAARDIEP